ncbi:MAG: hypothetical protein ACTSUE_15675 [Promethearchaeota archaeon]
MHAHWQRNELPVGMMTGEPVHQPPAGRLDCYESRDALADVPRPIVNIPR